jgi:signal transduction histidine kinase
MLGFLNLMLEQTKGIPKFENYELYIRNGANELLDIIQNIVEMAEIQTEKTKTLVETFELNALINAIKQEFKSNDLYLDNPNVQFKCSTPDIQNTINSDKTKIKEIYRHLIHNALKFTSQGIVDFGYEINNSKLEIFVKDTGIGIKQEDLPHIFNRFWKGYFEDNLFRGLGIGLSITKSYVDDLHGEIYVISTPNQSTEFRVIIPLS